jgi:hypothetical protein
MLISQLPPSGPIGDNPMVTEQNNDNRVHAISAVYAAVTLAVLPHHMFGAGVVVDGQGLLRYTSLELTGDMPDAAMCQNTIALVPVCLRYGMPVDCVQPTPAGVVT